MWLDKFTVALLQKDADSINALLDEVPNFTNVDDAKKASYLFREALELLYGLKNETVASMRQMKSHIDFLKANTPKPTNGLDVRS